jgi:hypothetical protein
VYLVVLLFPFHSLPLLVYLGAACAVVDLHIFSNKREYKELKHGDFLYALEK